MKTLKNLTALFTVLCSITAFAEPAMLTTYTPVGQQTLQAADTAHFTGSAQFARLPVIPSGGDVNKMEGFESR